MNLSKIPIAEAVAVVAGLAVALIVAIVVLTINNDPVPGVLTGGLTVVLGGGLGLALPSGVSSTVGAVVELARSSSGPARAGAPTDAQVAATGDHPSEVVPGPPGATEGPLAPPGAPVPPEAGG